MFGCPPDVAARQDVRIVQAIHDYRLARTAVDAFNLGARGIETMQQNPALLEILQAMHRAQTNTIPSIAAITADMAKRENPDDG